MSNGREAGWIEAPLGDLLTFQRGFDITKKEQVPGPYSVISSSGPASTHSEFKVKGPGVVIGRKGTLGTVFFSADDFWPHDTTLWVKDFHGNNERFAYYFIQTMRFEQYDVGASNPTLNRNHIHLIPVRFPPLTEQRRIADVLSAYDDLIENNTRRIAILEEMAQAIYRQWFVNFRFPGHEQMEMVESELGPVPTGWAVRRLGDEITLSYGKALKADDRREGATPVYGSSGVVGYHDEALVRGPGIVVGRKGNVGSVYWCDSDFYPIDTTYYVETELDLYFVYFNLIEQHFINNDAAVPGLNRNQAYSLPLIVPSREVLGQFSDMVRSMFAQHLNLRRRNALLRETRDLLLPRLISGEIEAGAVEGALAGMAS